jgi:endonuclease III
MVSTTEIARVFSLLEKTHPPTMLEQMKREYTPFQMLVATMLSARAKDSTTLPIVTKMFKTYPGPEDYVKIDVQKLEKIIFKIGFYRVKARNLKALSNMVLDKFNGKVPDTLDELTSLPGVGRKTANCILAYVFGKPAIAVDVHVHRISNRLGWVNTKTPEKTEFALMELVPKKLWVKANSMLVGHGQTLCKPIGPLCGKCQIKKYCKFGKDR